MLALLVPGVLMGASTVSTVPNVTPMLPLTGAGR